MTSAHVRIAWEPICQSLLVARVNDGPFAETGVPAPAATAAAIFPRSTENHNFHALADDGIRLWTDNRKLIESWPSASGSEVTVTTRLRGDSAAGVIRNPVTVDVFEFTPDALIAELRTSGALHGKPGDFQRRDLRKLDRVTAGLVH